MGDTSIQWTDKVWNPVRGCSLVSAGCRACYAMRQAHRFAGPGGTYEGLTKMTPAGPQWTGKVRLVPEALDAPLRWRKPRKVFVNSMSDLFHDAVPDEFVLQVFTVMAIAHRHTFQVLTKRPERMRRLLSKWRADDLYTYWNSFSGEPAECWGWPLPNVWLGVSVENQRAADERIPLLLDTPAAVRFLSCEPLLGPIDIRGSMWPVHPRWPSGFRSPEEAVAAGAKVTYHKQGYVLAGTPFVKWVIVGGESGPGARPCHVDWIRSIVEQCKAAGVACFVKQLGARPVTADCVCPADSWPMHLRDRKGADPSEWTDDLRVQEFPA